ncbi:unnamed protein product [Didymodactylos carnosus]|uniref:Uncharacterized protein n=1 Tax=Didymodactylos carnosus TaxID=1234261 RepID=A0A8S2VWL4_9BILA|nr:unnamed protein product [Didymodactylos carnosus]CAF4415657.1 unnamed protein product [Didymodactylos carnosus]
MNMSGTRLATASEKGTLIRIFDTETSQLVNELRRGANNATIHCLTSAATFLPKYFSSKWSSCKFPLPSNTLGICAFGPNSDANKTVITLCSDGSYSRFLITPKGECIQDQSRQFLEVGEDGT